MAKKGKGKGKGKGAKKKKTAEPEVKAPVSRYDGFDDELQLLERYRTAKDFVKLDLNLINWKFANFSVTVKLDTSMADIGRLIEEKHGRVASLQLYMSPPHEQNMIRDMRTKLRDLGLNGGTVEEPSEITLFYEFTTPETSPILLREPSLLPTPVS